MATREHNLFLVRRGGTSASMTTVVPAMAPPELLSTISIPTVVPPNRPLFGSEELIKQPELGVEPP